VAGGRSAGGRVVRGSAPSCRSRSRWRRRGPRS
jgi:hypothetical protein